MILKKNLRITVKKSMKNCENDENDENDDKLGQSYAKLISSWVT